tara:strand:- start:1254 stop:2078 length:825 start_codon:yes stop_codon:yes gene_type:complete
MTNFNFNKKFNYFNTSLITDGIKILILINFLIFFLQSISGQERILFQLFGIVPSNTFFNLMIWQPFTYLFFHGGVWHVFINMFVLWMFGSELEKIWGKKYFLKYYFLTGVGSGIITVLLSLNSLIPVVGASGAIYGILLAYGLTFPNRKVYLYFLIPIKVKFFVLFIGIIAFFSSFGSNDGISHLTHLSGMIIGFVYLKSNFQIDFFKKMILKYKLKFKNNLNYKKRQYEDDLRFEVDSILDKINKQGYDNLSEKEKIFLYEASKKLSQTQYRN